MNNALFDFRDAIRASGLEPPSVIDPGKRHRFPGIGKRNGNTAGWCKLFDDGLGGCFGDWSAGLSEHWQARQYRPLSSSDKQAFAIRVGEARRAEQFQRVTRQTEAAQTARSIWQQATPANNQHPYLTKKGIQGHGIKTHKGQLVIPVLTTEGIHSLQFIHRSGEKRFLTGGRIAGGYFLMGDFNKRRLLIAEGFATGATLHQETGYPVVVAFNAGNLKAVALAIRALYGQKDMVICGDNDHATPGNPGITKATEAAYLIGARIAIPTFNAGEPGTDWNDWYQSRIGGFR
ncbi:MAG: hypothetical protein DRR42_20500 [Gammaproteobacteria bacterium]|nr:MAG: hypothetical protein DRR42_20500 [Gammaproteobacteria bacterium]